MRFATWNLNNRVGKTRFKPFAAQAAIALDADVIVFTEYFPRHHHQLFSEVLSDAGWKYQLLPQESVEIANRTFVVARLPLEPDPLPLPDFDYQLPSNTVIARLPTVGLRVLGLRIPWYVPRSSPLRIKSWQWLEAAAAAMRFTPAVILGDLNEPITVRRGAVGGCLQRMLDNGWRAATPDQPHSYFGHRGTRSAVDHLFATAHIRVEWSEYVTALNGFTLAGSAESLSDHAALVVDLEIDGA